MQPRGRYADPAKQDGYICRRHKGLPHLQCKLCGAIFPIKSNLGVHEEAMRWGEYLDPDPEPACPNKQCSSFSKPVRAAPDCYRLSDQIIEIAIVDDKGETLVSTRVRPTCPVNPKALAMHGLSNDVLKSEPLFDEIEKQVIAAVQDKYVVMYSRDFDLRFLGDRVKSALKGSFCCMREFARFNGERRWNGEYLWKKLTEAASIAGYSWEGTPHQAIADALACRAVWDFMKPKLHLT